MPEVRHFKLTSMPYRLRAKYMKLSSSVFFNMIIRLFLESFIEIALTAAINIQHVRFSLNHLV
jgi:hypothetical protein